MLAGVERSNTGLVFDDRIETSLSEHRPLVRWQRFGYCVLIYPSNDV
jgi:hypothetical protein